MDIKLPNEYVINKFYQYSGFPKYNKYNQSYQACCPICREDNGKYWGKRKRLYYFPNEHYLYCHNCVKSWTPIKWIMEVTNSSFKEVLNEAEDGYDTINILEDIKPTPVNKPAASLPENSINLSDPQQIEFYKNSNIVKDCIQFIIDRRLDNAVNRPDRLYMSLTDPIHKNRLCIPFVNNLNKIEFYQTRAIYKKDEEQKAKYLSKINSEKTIFGLNKIYSNLDNIFIFEGPIDAMFIKNGIAVGGINLTPKQSSQLNTFAFHKKIWVPDCQYIDEAGYDNTMSLLNRGESVFIWPEDFNQYKDINEICMSNSLYEISHNFILKHTYSGTEGLDKLSKINLIA